jgi:hypothetical protein
MLKMGPGVRRASGVVLGAALLLRTGDVWCADATAPSKDACFDSYEAAQRLRQSVKLRAAREHLLVCTQETCPAFVRRDCTQWLAETDASTPTVVLTARGPDGGPAEAVSSWIDGVPLAKEIDGRAIPVDPGPHAMRYTLGGLAIDERVVIPEGAKNYELVADFTKVAPPPPLQPPPPTPRTRAEAPAVAAHDSGLPTATWVLGGVSAAGLVSFAAFGIAGRVVQGCAPDCTADQVHSLRADYLVADLSLAAGVVAAAGALWFALQGPRSAHTTWSLTFRATATGPGLSALARF